MHRALLLALALTGCDDGPSSYQDRLDDPQIPARGTADLATWLEAGHYLGWHCEPDRHPPRPGSAHGANRICSNDALAAAPGDGPFPVGAAAVKEVFDGGAISKYAVYRKVREGTGGATWYWYEGDLRDDVIANGEAESSCTDCHSGAPRDFVFTVVR